MSSVFWRIKNHAQPRPSVFNRITKTKESSNPLRQEQKDSMFNQLGDGTKVQSSIPSRMKRFSTLDVKIDGSLMVKRCNVVFTSQPSSFDSNKEDEEEEVASSNHITVQEYEDSKS